jgi:hypothetical protein
VQIRLSDVNGKIISTSVLKGQSGNWRTQVQAAQLPAGTYYLTVAQNGEVVHTEAVQKK